MPIRRTPRPEPAGDAGAAHRVRPEQLSEMFAAPAWLRDRGVRVAGHLGLRDADGRAGHPVTPPPDPATP